VVSRGLAPIKSLVQLSLPRGGLTSDN